MTSQEQILLELDKIEAKLKKFLIGLKESELKQLLAEDNLNRLLQYVGLEDWIKKYSANFDVIFKEAISKFAKLEYVKKNINSIQTIMNQVKNSNERTIVGYIKANADNIQGKLINMLLSGTTSRQTIEAILNESPLHTRAQTGSVVNTAIADYSRITERQVFTKDDNQRFEYVGGLIPTSSETCSWLIENQKSEGYTMAEIDAGIDTPYGIVDWNGRRPNYNCIHSWSPIE